MNMSYIESNLTGRDHPNHTSWSFGQAMHTQALDGIFERSHTPGGYQGQSSTHLGRRTIHQRLPHLRMQTYTPIANSDRNEGRLRESSSNASASYLKPKDGFWFWLAKRGGVRSSRHSKPTLHKNCASKKESPAGIRYIVVVSKHTTSLPPHNGEP